MGSFVVDWDNALHKPGQDEIYLTCWNIYPNELGNDNNAEERTEFTFNLFRLRPLWQFIFLTCLFIVFSS